MLKEQDTTCEEDALNLIVRNALASIRDVGEGCVAEIIRERQKKPFGNLKDFLARLQKSGTLNKSAVEVLIKAGALDGIGHTRKYLMEHYQEISDQLQYEKKNGMLGQPSLLALFSGPKEEPSVKEEEYAASKLLAYEKEVLGIYLSGHPLDEHYEQWITDITAKSGDFLCREEGVALSEGDTAVVGGMIRTVTLRTTRKKKQMACLVLEDLVGSMDVIVFPEQFERFHSFLEEGMMVFCRGKVKREEEKDACLQLDSVFLFSTEERNQSIWLQFSDFADYQEKEPRLVSIMRKYPGKDKICFYLKKQSRSSRDKKRFVLTKHVWMIWL